MQALGMARMDTGTGIAPGVPWACCKRAGQKMAPAARDEFWSMPLKQIRKTAGQSRLDARRGRTCLPCQGARLCQRIRNSTRRFHIDLAIEPLSRAGLLPAHQTQEKAMIEEIGAPALKFMFDC